MPPQYFRDYKGITIRDRWRLEGEIGSGGFGQVYLATDLETNKFVAVKLCYLKANSSNSSLQRESFFYRTLKDQPGIATLHDIGSDSQQSIEFMVCELLGASLWDLVVGCGRRFSLKTTLMLADQLISRVEMLHSKNLIHRDLKMENIVMGYGKQNGTTAYILDFGLSGYFRPQDNYIAAPEYPMAGTIETACIAWHLNRPQSPKDDLESLAYIFIHLLRGYLPWSLDGGDSDGAVISSKSVLKMKLSLPIEIICKDMPSEFARHLKYVRSLKYDDTPNYGKLRDMYRRLMKRMGYEYDGVYDWDLIDQKSDTIKQPSGDAVPASVQDAPMEQDDPVEQSNSVVQDTPFVQDQPLVQDIPPTQCKILKRKKSNEEDEEDYQMDSQEQVTKPAKKRKIVPPQKPVDKDQPATKRRGRQPKAETKEASTKNAQQEVVATEEAFKVKNKAVADKKASPKKKLATRMEARK